MNGFTIKGFNHTGFTVRDLDGTVRFFTEALGFELQSLASRDPDQIGRITGLGRAVLRVAYVAGYGHRIELLEYGSPPDGTVANYRTCDVGAAHVALDVDDLAAVRAVCEPWGWRLMGEVVAVNAGPNQGRLVAYLRHDNGIILELIQQPADR